ncbi:hypothetical protein JCM10213_009039 [Rhodosporidiobolus nylandii]
MEYLAQPDYEHHPALEFDESSSSGDGSSSSSGDHSSPAYSAHSEQSWALDLGLSMPWSPSQSALDPASFAAVKLAPRGGSAAPSSSGAGGAGGEFPQLAGDFWSASPGAVSARETLSPSVDEGYFGSAKVKQEERDEPLTAQAMDFEDMVHEGLCGPSALNPLPSGIPTPLASSSAPPSAAQSAMHYLPPSSTASPHRHSFLPPLSVPPHPPQQQPAQQQQLNPAMLAGGIAPTLTSGAPGNPLAGVALPPIPGLSAASGGEGSEGGVATRSSARSSIGGVDDTMQPGRSGSRSRTAAAAATAGRDPSLSRLSDLSSSTGSSSFVPPVAGPLLTPTGLHPHPHPHIPPILPSGKPAYTPSGSLNLVARDAVLPAELIPTLVSPPAYTLVGGPSPPAVGGRKKKAVAVAPPAPVPVMEQQGEGAKPPAELLVLGVPTVGAKSRVETQIKISLALVRPQSSVPSSSASTSADAVGVEQYVLEDGGLHPRAGGELERVGSWSYVRLPKILALKARPPRGAQQAGQRRVVKPEPPADQTLTLSVSVVSASNPAQEIFICPNCQQRELKRSLRKKDPKGKPGQPAPPPPPPPPPVPEEERDEEVEKRKVVVFNAPEFVEFATGEVVLPTRITCYCRHHKEKKGFRVTYALHDHLGNLVARGETPPIMITDDHKTAASKLVPPPSTAYPAPPSLAGEPAVGTKRKASAAPAVAAPFTPANAKPPKEKREKKAKEPSPALSSHSASGRPRRSTAGRSSRRVQGQPPAPAENAAVPIPMEEDGPTASKKPRPYDADEPPARQSRRTGSARSPTFGMTPLVPMQTSVAGSPSTVSLAGFSTSGPTDDGAQTPGAAASPQSPFGSALGLLGGMADQSMASAGGATTPGSTAAAGGFFQLGGRSGSIDTSHATFDFRAGVSTPPLSPGSTAPSVADTFHSLFSGFPSPQPSLLEPNLAPAPPQRLPSLQPQQQPGQFPSFAIPAVDPLPTSLTPDWASLQQQYQQAAPAAPTPRINRIIPGEGPVHGGIEVTVLGEHFAEGLVCVFGDSPALPTHFWSSNTLVCVLPPSANPGPVVVGIKGVPLTVEQGTPLQLFTYKDDSDRSLLELALQVVGLKMTGKMESASAIAMRIVGNSPASGSSATMGASPSAAGGPTDTASLAATLNAAATSVYATPAASRASSRRSSFSGSPRPSTIALSAEVVAGETRNFQDIVIKFLSLLDLDPSLIPGAAPSLPSARPPISQANAQQHTLLHLAAVLGFHRLVAFLLARGIALDAPDRNGFTALHFAALYGRVAIARMLLDAGARVGVRNLAGKTPLDIALERDDVDVEELLVARGAASVTPTLSTSARSPLTPLSPPQRFRALDGRRASLELEDDESEEDWSSSEDRDSAYGADEYSSASASEEGGNTEEEWPTSSEDSDTDDGAGGDSGEEADESTFERAPLRRVSRHASRNASTVSLHYLLEAEEEAKEERRGSPRSRRVALPAEEDIPAAVPVSVPSAPITPLNHLATAATASSAWLSQKVRPTVQPSLDKLHDFAERAKANGFTLPPMQLHMPEIAAFQAMPAALSRRMSGPGRHRSRSVGAGQAQTPESELEDGASTAFSAWRAFSSAPHWFQKTPSSPPPQYTPTDSLAGAPVEKEKAPVASSSSAIIEELDSPTSSLPPSPTASSRASPVAFMRQRPRRRTSATSYTSDATDTDSEAFRGEHGKLVGFAGDKMLFFFWLPVLVFVLGFAWWNWRQYAQPVIDTLADTILPRSIGRLLT